MNCLFGKFFWANPKNSRLEQEFNQLMEDPFLSFIGEQQIENINEIIDRLDNKPTDKFRSYWGRIKGFLSKVDDDYFHDDMSVETQVGDDGNFLFQCSRGYYVENGEIQYPIRDSSLSGNIMSFLQQIEQTTKTFEMYTGYFGGCGKAGQSPLAVGMGGPELLVSEVMIGGTK